MVVAAAGGAGAPAIEVTEDPRLADIGALQRGLADYNRPWLGAPDHARLAAFARQGGRVVGGISASTARGWLYLEMVWIDAAQRRRGLGSRLLETIERRAVATGCRAALLDTFDFQARPFYERHGYRVFGELEHAPGGPKRWFMTKALHGSPPPARPLSPGWPGGRVP